MKSQKLKIIQKSIRFMIARIGGQKLCACAYIRVSTDSHDQENSLKNQRAHYEKFIAHSPIGMSGFSPTGISALASEIALGFARWLRPARMGK